MERRLALNRAGQPRALLWGVIGTLVLLGMFLAGLKMAFGSRPLPPSFDHVVLIVLENREYNDIIDNPKMPFFNRLAAENVLLTAYHGIRHPSLPNYIALITGDTHGIEDDCLDCYLDAPSLPQQIQASNRTWKGYLEDLPSPCYSGGNQGQYAKRHNPFVYIDSIRLNESACRQSVVPLIQLNQDLRNQDLPNFSVIVPNVCNDSHDCEMDVTDAWLSAWVPKILAAQAMQKNSLLVITFDEGTSEATCCGLSTAGGRVATVLISPRAKAGYVDSTSYSHYSLLKTIETGWRLNLLGHAREANLILDPWVPKKWFERGWLP